MSDDEHTTRTASSFSASLRRTLGTGARVRTQQARMITRELLRRAGARCVLCLLLLSCCLAPSARAGDASVTELVKHVSENGGAVGFRVGKACPTCVRGGFAARDFNGSRSWE